jgi:DNA polymerase/3'-5' exonuclease PolX
VSNNIPVPWAQARSVASALEHYLSPACHRIEVAGSLRRMKPMVRDIELVAIPKMDIDLFGNPLETSYIDSILDDKPVTFHKKGRKYWQFSFVGTSGYEYTVDLFLQPDPATWAVNYLLRTGSSDFSHRMVTAKSFGGHKPDGYEVRDARVWSDGVALDLADEQDIFDLWGMEFVKPKDRI